MTHSILLSILALMSAALFNMQSILALQKEPEEIKLGAISEFIPVHLKLKSTADKIIGQKEIGATGIIEYAYKSDVKIIETVNEELSKRTKHSRTFKTDRPNDFVSEFISGEPQYYKDLNDDWWIADYGTTTKKSFQQQTGRILGYKDLNNGGNWWKYDNYSESVRQIKRSFANFLAKTAFGATDTFYPDANSVDGFVARNSGCWATGQVWGDLIAGAGTGTDGGASEESLVVGAAADPTDTYCNMRHGVYGFDTDPTFTASIDVTAATLSVWGYGKSSDITGAAPDINVYSANPASETALVNADYAQVGTTPYSTAVTLTNFDGSDTAYQVFTLNADGLVYIEDSAASNINAEFSTRNANYEVAGTAFTWGARKGYNFNIRLSETVGTANDPKLTVTWTDLGGGAAVVDETSIISIFE